MHALFLAMGKSPAQISAAWDDLSVSHPTDTDTTGARTITFGGGSRTITLTEAAGDLTFEYSIDGGAYSAYSTGFALTSGQTLNWRGTFTSNVVGATCRVYVDGILLDTFTATATGFP